MDKHLISIVMPTYNRSYVIQKAIQSVIDQTYQNWELIIVDDASTDDTEALIKEIKDSRVMYVKNEENKGANFSRNRGCALAKGEYLAFLDSDNFWTTDKLEKQIDALTNCSDNIAFVFCRVKIVDEDEWTVPEQGFDIQKLRETLRKENVVDTNTVMMKRQIFEEVGRFDEEMPRLQDWELFFRTIVVYQYDAKYIHEVMSFGTIQPNSIGRSSRKLQDAILLFLEKHKKYFSNNEILMHVKNLYNIAADDGNRQRCYEIILKSKELNCLEMVWNSVSQLYNQTRYYETLFAWKEKMEKSKERTIFSDYVKSDTKVVAIYGLGRWGEAVYQEMTNAGIKVSFGIDQKVKEFHDLIVIKPEEISMHIDVIIVSVFQQYQEIYDMLSKYYKGEILSIEDIIRNMEA